MNSKLKPMLTNTTERLLRPAVAADMLGLSRRTLRRYETQGLLRGIKLNQRVTRYRQSEIVALMQLQ
jgi:predicted site-specific integrase-resolvase